MGHNKDNKKDKKKGKKKDKKPKNSNKFFIVLFFVFLSILSGFIVQIFAQLPDLSKLKTLESFESTIIYSYDNTVLGTIHGEQNRVSVPLSQISKNLQKAVIASEDSEFYSHKGISLRSIARALVMNIFSGRFAQGGSTITQQLARTMFLSNRKTILRKATEIYLALELEKKFTKEEILEMYLNQVYWGHNTYGAEAASQIYFGKHASDLTLSECGLLAGILGAPEIYSPYKNFNLTLKRRGMVLDKMEKLQMISKIHADSAKREKIELSMIRVNKYKFNSPHFTTYILSQLIEKYGRDIVNTGGLKVYTTISIPIQKIAESAVSKFILEEGSKYHFTQAALVAIDPRTGYVLAMIGGSNFNESEFNRATQAKRSPGSAFKPFIYTAAMEKGFSPGDILYDSPAVFDVFPDAHHPDGKWKPLNFDKKFRGPVTIRYALEHSLNIPSIKLLQKVGISDAISVARRMGITSALSESLSLTLGTSDISLLEMTSAYGTFAFDGIRVPPTSIYKIIDKDNKVIYEPEIKGEQALDKNVSRAMVDLMKGVISNGTGRRANIGRSAAAKTGTSEKFRDAWFIGFVPQLVTGVWVGNDDNTPMKGVAEVSVCPRIWKSFMEKVLIDTPKEELPPPTGFVSVKICLDSGQLAGPNCPKNKIRWAQFWEGKEPKNECPVKHKSLDSKKISDDENDLKEDAF